MPDLTDTLNIYFDGGCQPTNPGGVATSGWFITNEKGQLLAEGAKVVADGGEKATNNYAEYCALGLALRHLVDEGWKGKKLTIRGDSRLIVEQGAGNWKCKAPHLKPLLEKIHQHLGALEIEEGWTIHWVRRSSNGHAHQLAENEYHDYLKRSSQG